MLQLLPQPGVLILSVQASLQLPVGSFGSGLGLGIRQSRYFGRTRTKFQLYLAATVANLTLVAGKLARLRRAGGGPAGCRAVSNIVDGNAAASFSPLHLGLLWPGTLLWAALLLKWLYPTRTFRPDF